MAKDKTEPETEVETKVETEAETEVETTVDAGGFIKVVFNTAYGNCYKAGDIDDLPEDKAKILIGSGIAKSA